MSSFGFINKNFNIKQPKIKSRSALEGYSELQIKTKGKGKMLLSHGVINRRKNNNVNFFSAIIENKIENDKSSSK